MSDQSLAASVAATPPAARPVAADRELSRKRWWRTAGAIVLGGIVLVGGLVGLVFALTQPLADAGDAFMAALRDERYAAAFELCTPALQREVGSPQGLERRARSGNLRPTSWLFHRRKVNLGTGRLEGKAALAGGGSAQVRLLFDQVGGDWKVSGLTFR